MCQLREHLARIFFPVHCTCMNFFWHNGLVQEFFSLAYTLAGYFFSKSPTPPPPPPSEVEWSAPNILQHLLIAKCKMQILFFFLLFKHPREKHLPSNLALG